MNRPPGASLTPAFGAGAGGAPAPVRPGERVATVGMAPGRSSAQPDWLLRILDSSTGLGALIVGEVLLVHLYTIPSEMRLSWYAFGDHGTDLTLQFLIQQGYRPELDFGYPYGTLALLLGRLCVALLGMTPLACEAARIACDVAFGCALAAAARRLRLGLAGLGLIFVGVPFSLMFTFLIAHGLERALLSWALAEQAGGKRGNALAFATAAVFAKPSMGYVYGFLLLLAIAWDACRETPRSGARVLRSLVPALITVTLLLLALTAIYGLPSVVHTLIPMRGMYIYRSLRFGLFTGIGSVFWYFPGVHIGYYFGTVVAFWGFAGLWLVLGSVYAAQALIRTPDLDDSVERSRELVICCALVHIAFVTLFFGSNMSWAYYVYFLVVGATALSTWGPVASKVGLSLVLIGALGQKSMIVDNYRRWVHDAPSPETAGLWVAPQEREEWKQVLNLVAGRRAVVLDMDGAPGILFDAFEKPVGAWLIPGDTTPQELDREISQLAHASIAVVPTLLEIMGKPDELPRIKPELVVWRVIWRGRFFVVYERLQAPRG